MRYSARVDRCKTSTNVTIERKHMIDSHDSRTNGEDDGMTEKAAIHNREAILDQEKKQQAKPSFEELFQQNERRIHYHIHKLNIQDPHHEFFVEGMYAMWCAYKNYRPDQGVMSTYFNYIIRNRLIDMLRKKTRETHNEENYIQQQKPNLDNGNRDCQTNQPIPDRGGIEITDHPFWQQVQSILTANQWKWVKYYIMDDLPLKEIAEQEGVTMEAVKSWGKTAKKRLEKAGVKAWLD